MLKTQIQQSWTLQLNENFNSTNGTIQVFS